MNPSPSSTGEHLGHAVPAPDEGRGPPILVIGLGNPILGDDGFGWHVASALQAGLATSPRGTGLRVEVDCASLGGLRLMERMLGYERVILVDSMETGLVPEGELHACTLEELPDPTAGHSASAHDTSLRNALELGRASGAAVPSCVHVVGIETRNTYRFSELLSESVSKAVPLAVATVRQLIAKEER